MPLPLMNIHRNNEVGFISTNPKLLPAITPYQAAQVYFLFLTAPVLLSTYLYTHVLMERPIYAYLFFFTFLMVGSAFAFNGIGFDLSMFNKKLSYISKILFSMITLSFLIMYALNGPLAMLLAREWYFTILFPALGMYGLLSLLNSFFMTRYIDHSEASVTIWLSAVREVRYSMLWPYLFSLTLMTGLLCTTSMKMVMESLFIESAIAQAESSEVQPVPSKAKAIPTDGSPMNKAIVGGLTSAGVALICLSSTPFSALLLVMVVGGSFTVGAGCYGLAENYNISYYTAAGVGAGAGTALALGIKAVAGAKQGSHTTPEPDNRMSRVYLAPEGPSDVKRPADTPLNADQLAELRGILLRRYELWEEKMEASGLLRPRQSERMEEPTAPPDSPGAQGPQEYVEDGYEEEDYAQVLDLDFLNALRNHESAPRQSAAADNAQDEAEAMNRAFNTKQARER